MKHIKALIYGDPGVGKSIFAGHAPKALFLTTDGNYEYLEGMIPNYSEKNCIKITSYKQFKDKISDVKLFEGYETIVVDLLEDLFLWDCSEFCAQKGIEDVGDLGFAKGYTLTRDDFFITISKLLSIDKNVILLTHGIETVSKDRRGVEHTKFSPTNKIPEKLLTQIEGRLQFALRAYASTEEDNTGDIAVKRYLSLSPDGTSEWGVTRRINGNTCPKSIPLDWDTFMAVIDANAPKIGEKAVVNEVVKEEVKVEPQVVKVEPKVVVPEVKVVVPEVKVEPQVVESKPIVEEVKPVVEQQKPQGEVVNGEDKIAALRAKLAAMKK